MSDIVKVLPYSIDLNETIKKTELHTLFVMGDNQAHRFEIEIKRGSEVVDLTGATVKGYFTNFKAKTTIEVTGKEEGGKAVVTLNKPCYTLHGQFVLIIQVKIGGVEASIFEGEGFMRASKAEKVVYDDYVVYDMDMLLAQIDDMKKATENANKAAENANAAAGHAPYVDAETGFWMYWDAAAGKYVNTGTKATGPQGISGNTPYIGDNGNWWIGESDTGTKAQGPQGSAVGIDDKTVSSATTYSSEKIEEELELLNQSTEVHIGEDEPDEEGIKLWVDTDESIVEYVTPQMFGAVADRTTDDSAAVQAAFNASNFILFPKGDYCFSGITCDHDVHVIFSGANLVPVHPAYDHSTQDGSNLVSEETGVFENFFSFSGCSVTMEGLALLADEEATGRASDISLCPPTRSIAEFDTCHVTLRDWHVRGLSLWNRGNTPTEFYDRRGIIFSAIDTDIFVQDCLFEDIQGDEWTWSTKRDDIYAAKCAFDRCTFRLSSDYKLEPIEDGSTAGKTKPGQTCANIFLTSEAMVQNCIFEDINYYGSLANLAAFRAIFRGNMIVRCDVGGVCDFLEGSVGYITADDVIVEGNVMGNSTCGKFANMAARRMVVRGNSGISAKQFVFSTFPYSTHIFSDEGTVTSIRILIESNDVVCTGEEVAASDNAFIRFKYTKQTGAWESSNSEAIVKNNRFVRSGSVRMNPCIVAANLTRLNVHDNTLFFGSPASESVYAYAVQTTESDITTQHVYMTGNVFESNTIPSESTSGNRFGLRIAGSDVTLLRKLIAGNTLFPSANVQIESVTVNTDATKTETTSGNVGFSE